MQTCKGISIQDNDIWATQTCLWSYFHSAQYVNFYSLNHKIHMNYPSSAQKMVKSH